MPTLLSVSKPRTHHYSYSNPDSQGALIRQSNAWPTPIARMQLSFNNIDSFEESFYRGKAREIKSSKVEEAASYPVPEGFQHTAAYSDRIQGWDANRYQRACDLAGTGDQGWSHTLTQLTEEGFLEFAKVALNIEGCTQIHSARAVHYYNVANGFSCPVIEAIYK